MKYKEQQTYLTQETAVSVSCETKSKCTKRDAVVHLVPVVIVRRGFLHWVIIIILKQTGSFFSPTTNKLHLTKMIAQC